ncbi:hypothetical protein [Pseudomonas fluorescens]|uniref:hypothetical protein n=1 Tax=Pseudomonas fluorescens TaxID=294 RepID=UPI000F48118C|nr:hypothetical protein [Pseudomonas fluorescens]RON86761.1 hypothetical protein BK668_18560 [Pseudomonas fluorescens]VVM55050.1 hypothetical protein PS681_00964 [Pseudomonas fluorescens]VVN49924.1 hypothetical protein PS684_00123 [Pseudomonas fluorescens]
MTETHTPSPIKKSRIPEAIFAACIAAFAGLFAAALTWYSAEQALRLSTTESCIRKIDQQEDDLREKTGKFLALDAEWLVTSENPNFNIDDYYKAGGKAIAAAQELSVNAPLRFGLAAVMAGDSIRQRMNVKSEEEKAAVLKELKSDDYDLFKFFFDEISVFEEKRKACNSRS